MQGVVSYLYWLGQLAKVSVDEVLTLKEVTEGKNLVAHEVIKIGLGAEVELLSTQRGGDYENIRKSLLGGIERAELSH